MRLCWLGHGEEADEHVFSPFRCRTRSNVRGMVYPHAVNGIDDRQFEVEGIRLIVVGIPMPYERLHLLGIREKGTRRKCR